MVEERGKEETGRVKGEAVPGRTDLDSSAQLSSAQLRLFPPPFFHLTTRNFLRLSQSITS